MGGRPRELVGPGSNWEGSCFWLDHGGLRLVPCMAAVRISLAGPAAGRDCHVVNLRALFGPSRSSLVGWLGPERLHLAGAEHQDEQGNMAVKPPVGSGANLRLNCSVFRQQSSSSFTRHLHAWDLSGVHGEKKKRRPLAVGSRDARKSQDPLPTAD